MMKTIASLTLALLPCGFAHAGVAGNSYVGEFRIRSLGNCAAAELEFGEQDVTLRECNSFDGTFSEIDLFFVGFWSFEGVATQLETGLEGPVIASGIHVFGGARIHGSGNYQGFDLKLWGVRVEREPSDPPRLPAPAFELPGADPHRSPARL